jgi:hypothetical protein
MALIINQIYIYMQPIYSPYTDVNETLHTETETPMPRDEIDETETFQKMSRDRLKTFETARLYNPLAITPRRCRDVTSRYETRRHRARRQKKN